MFCFHILFCFKEKLFFFSTHDYFLGNIYEFKRILSKKQTFLTLPLRASVERLIVNVQSAAADLRSAPRRFVMFLVKAVCISEFLSSLKTNKTIDSMFVFIPKAFN